MDELNQITGIFISTPKIRRILKFLRYLENHKNDIYGEKLKKFETDISYYKRLFKNGLREE